MAADLGRIVVRYDAGNSDVNDINGTIKSVWTDILDNPAHRAQAAKLLGIEEAELRKEKPPFEAEQSGSGLTGGELVILFATSFALGFVEELGSQLGKDAAKRLRALWIDYFADPVNPPGSNKLGASKD